jgi:hypothetical protein
MVINEWCKCGNKIPVIKEGVVFCENCNSIVPCEFCEAKATVILTGYFTCELHAIDNVVGRKW